jgi:hypothetical protein
LPSMGNNSCGWYEMGYKVGKGGRKWGVSLHTYDARVKSRALYAQFAALVKQNRTHAHFTTLVKGNRRRKNRGRRGRKCLTLDPKIVIMAM